MSVLQQPKPVPLPEIFEPFDKVPSAGPDDAKIPSVASRESGGTETPVASSVLPRLLIPDVPEVVQERSNETPGVTEEILDKPLSSHDGTSTRDILSPDITGVKETIDVPSSELKDSQEKRVQSFDRTSAHDVPLPSKTVSEKEISNALSSEPEDSLGKQSSKTGVEEKPHGHSAEHEGDQGKPTKSVDVLLSTKASEKEMAVGLSAEPEESQETPTQSVHNIPTDDAPLSSKAAEETVTKDAPEKPTESVHNISAELEGTEEELTKPADKTSTHGMLFPSKTHMEETRDVHPVEVEDAQEIPKQSDHKSYVLDAPVSSKTDVKQTSDVFPAEHEGAQEKPIRKSVDKTSVHDVLLRSRDSEKEITAVPFTEPGDSQGEPTKSVDKTKSDDSPLPSKTGIDETPDGILPSKTSNKEISDFSSAKPGDYEEKPEEFADKTSAQDVLLSSEEGVKGTPGLSSAELVGAQEKPTKSVEKTSSHDLAGSQEIVKERTVSSIAGDEGSLKKYPSKISVTTAGDTTEVQPITSEPKTSQGKVELIFY